MPRLLVTDEVDPEGLAVLRAVPSFQVDEVPTLPPGDLLARIHDYDAFIGRSASKVSGELLRAATKLRVVGRAGVGVDNVDLATATELGIAVINAPSGNTVAVAELFFGALIGLLRSIPRATTGMHEGQWERSQLLGTEARGRTLGVVGLGRIGSAVATRAKAFGMDVVAYDPYIPVERFDTHGVTRAETLEALLAAADIVTLHVPLTDETTGMVGAAELAQLTPGAIVANLARGGIIDEDALIAALNSGHVGGALIDAFTKEPLTGAHKFRGVPNVLLTPHLGASTKEAQRNVAVDVCEAVRDLLLHDELSRSLNAGGGPEDWRTVRPALAVARLIAVVARAVLAGRGQKAIAGLSLRVGKEFAEAREPLLAAAATGVLEASVDQGRVNLVNARQVAAARGIELSLVEGGESKLQRALELTLRAGQAPGDSLLIRGYVPQKGTPRLTRLGAYKVDVALRSPMIIITNHDVPGVIGRVGTALGNAQVNIAEYHQARIEQGGDALAVIAVDGAVSSAVREMLLKLPDVKTATVVEFAN